MTDDRTGAAEALSVLRAALAEQAAALADAERRLDRGLAADIARTPRVAGPATGPPQPFDGGEGQCRSTPATAAE